MKRIHTLLFCQRDCLHPISGAVFLQITPAYGLHFRLADWKQFVEMESIWIKVNPSAFFDMMEVVSCLDHHNVKNNPQNVSIRPHDKRNNIEMACITPYNIQYV